MASGAIGDASLLVRRLRAVPLFAGTLTGARQSEASLPARASDPVRITPKSSPEAWVELETLDSRPVVAESVDSVKVFAGAARATDLVRAPLPNGYEEIRSLRDPSAPTTFRQRVRTGPAIAALRLREGHVEAVDAKGYVHVATAPMLAVDARGAQRALTVSLEGDVVVARLDPSGLSFPIAIDPLWSTVASVSTPRTQGTLVGLGNRRALYVGGTTTAAVGTTEQYDAATNTWTTRPAMATGRAGATAVYLPTTNKVLVCGGVDAGSAALSSCERYDVATNTWAAAAPMNTTRPIGFSLVAMPSGAKALLIDNTTQSYAYDGATNVWSAIASLVPTAPLYSFMTARLDDGRIMVAGGGTLPPPGVGSITNKAASLYNPATNTWAAANPMPNAHMLGRSVVVGGKVYVFGGLAWCAIASGFTGCTTKATEVFDPATGAWTSGVDLAQAPTAAYALSNGRGYVFEQSGIWELLTPGSTGIAALTTAGTDASGNTVSAQISPSEVLFLGGSGTGNALFALGAAGGGCVFGFECQTGYCTGGACCEVASCASGFVCNGPTKPGKCVKLLGDKCGANADCDSGFCVDGACCNAACGGQCQACDVPGKVGTCTPVFGPAHGSRPACSGAGSTNACVRMACDGADVTACKYPGAGVPCGADSCAAGVETHVSACDGKGSCSDVPKSCGSYACSGSACKVSCAATSDCATGFYCDTAKSACVPLTGLGRKCDASTPCTAALSCVDGVCCSKPTCGALASCAVPGKEGSCMLLPGAACTGDLDCGSGHCVDGVCCDSSCSGQCEACDLKGSEGTCTPVTGKPHGLRAACASDPTNACARRLCDGATRGSCEGFVGSDIECRETSCDAGASVARAACDGKGSCPAVISTSCDGFQCAPDGLSCLSSCTLDAECLDGFVCLGQRCTRRTAVCSSDGVAVVDVDGRRTECVKFRCRAGVCLTECATSADCQTGLACNPSTATCEAPAAAEESGCSLGRSSLAGNTHGRFGGAGLALLMLSLVLSRLSRRTRHS